MKVLGKAIASTTGAFIGVFIVATLFGENDSLLEAARMSVYWIMFVIAVRMAKQIWEW